jgi:hypothetical protein
MSANAITDVESKSRVLSRRRNVDVQFSLICISSPEILVQFSLHYANLMTGRSIIIIVNQFAENIL